MSYYIEKPSTNSLRTDRYRRCKILIDKESSETLLSTRDSEEIQSSPSDILHTIKPDEVGRLDKISQTYYSTPLLWWVIAQANDIYDVFTSMKAGDRLSIPAIESLYGNRGILL